VRHYGLLANGQRQARLAVCRRLLLVANLAAALPGVETAPLTPTAPPCCPHCGGTRLVYRALAAADPTPTAVRPASSWPGLVGNAALQGHAEALPRSSCAPTHRPGRRRSWPPFVTRC